MYGISRRRAAPEAGWPASARRGCASGAFMGRRAPCRAGWISVARSRHLKVVIIAVQHAAAGQATCRPARGGGLIPLRLGTAACEKRVCERVCHTIPANSGAHRAPRPARFHGEDMKLVLHTAALAATLAMAGTAHAQTEIQWWMNGSTCTILIIFFFSEGQK